MNSLTYYNEFIDVLLITVSIIVGIPLKFKLPLTFTLFKVVCPETFNDDINVDASETTKLLKLVLSFKSLIDNNVDVENVEKVVISTYPDKSIDN